MIKKILFTLFLCSATVGFSQEKEIEDLSSAPNPFKLNTTITFKIDTKTTITLLVKNVLGKIVFENINHKSYESTLPIDY